MTNQKMIGVLLAGMSFGGMAISPRSEGLARAADDRKGDQKGGQKSCGGDKGCGADRGKSADKPGDGKSQSGADKDKDKDHKGGGKKSCGGEKGCGANR